MATRQAITELTPEDFKQVIIENKPGRYLTEEKNKWFALKIDCDGNQLQRNGTIRKYIISWLKR